MPIGFHIKNPPGPHFEAMGGALEKMINPEVFKAATLAGGMVARVLQRTQGGSGELARSFLPATWIKTKGPIISAGALSSLPYAGIQDRGGTIRAKNRLLAVPITRKAKTMWPRDWPRDELAYVQSVKSRKPLLIDAKQQFGKKMIVHYVLKRFNKIKGKRYLAKAQKQSERKHGESLTQSVRASVQKGVKARG